jgi:hypothetical protein
VKLLKIQLLRELDESSAALKEELDLNERTKAGMNTQLTQLRDQTQGLESEIAALKEDKEITREQLQAANEEKLGLEKRESSLMDVIVSLRNKQTRLESSLTIGLSGSNQVSQQNGTKKRTLSEMEGREFATIKELELGSTSSSEAQPYIKREKCEEMMPKIKVKHWAPDGYYHVKEVSRFAVTSSFLYSSFLILFTIAFSKEAYKEGGSSRF